MSPNVFLALVHMLIPLSETSTIDCPIFFVVEKKLIPKVHTVAAAISPVPITLSASSFIPKDLS